MAAFSYQHHSFLLDQTSLPNTPLKVTAFLEEPNNNSSFSTQIYPPESLLQIRFDVSSNEHSVTNKLSTEYSSSVVDKPENGDQVSQKVTSMDKKRKNRYESPLNSAQSLDKIREVKGKKQKKSKDDQKEEKLNQKKTCEEALAGYIHVRARRGQATDSHSLAERVRREKISERLKLLQALVPGCDKVTGKALILDEIINYVQSLQNQIEFLSIKLASVDPMFNDPGMDLDALMATPEEIGQLWWNEDDQRQKTS